MKGRFRLAALAVVFCCPLVVGAHELRPAYLELKQLGAETYDVLWKVPAKGELRLGLYVLLPAECAEIGDRTVYPAEDAFIERWKVSCPGGIAGKTIAIDGLATSLTDVLVRIQFAEDATQTIRLNAAKTSFVVPEQPSWRQLAMAYTTLGVEHILLGVDHLLFVWGLMMIVRSKSTLVKTITAFTVAHSLTLGLAVLGMVTVPTRAVDATIALSIAFLGAEILRGWRGDMGLTHRYPWVVAFAFGLLHGLGFAGALTTLGLPNRDVPLALLFFNVGVELGQLGFVVLVLASLRSLRVLQIHWSQWANRIPAYAIGTLGAFWTIQRIAVMFAEA